MSLVLKVAKQNIDLQTRKIDKILDMSDEDRVRRGTISGAASGGTVPG